ncbi:hypothetical protein N177_0792 [Lutibaculum baratangense AMV1]|uniref:VWFA domain-containing protein n=1 Tax=Lutibaculum baratangense AMV1 TaxID=631454 RepID=V4TL76_9HYPH|nr:hypothetical protein N177_0792 [Lutibaculum baratangense AMV1]
MLLMPILAAIGVALDVGRAGSAHSKLQNALDAAALAMSVDAPWHSGQGLEPYARQILKENFGAGQGAEITSVSVERSSEDLVLKAEAHLPSTFAGLIGVERIPLSATTNTVWGGNPVEVALVLDNTGSMASSSKMATLKVAVHNMLGILEQGTLDQEAVAVGIVPFATQVRIARTYEIALWLRKLDASASKPWWWPKSWPWTDSWDGCVTDRDQPYDVDDTLQASETTKHPAAKCAVTGLQELLPLTDDFTALRDKVDDMRADGNTNVTIGIAWGMAMLSHHAPLEEASVPGTVRGMKQVMVVLTDGENAQNRFTSDRTSIDRRTELACQAAKDAGIEVFTVRVVEGNRNLLRDCATDPDHYFDVENVDDLLPVFQTISTRISELRIAR